MGQSIIRLLSFHRLCQLREHRVSSRPRVEQTDLTIRDRRQFFRQNAGIVFGVAHAFVYFLYRQRSRDFSSLSFQSGHLITETTRRMTLDDESTQVLNFQQQALRKTVAVNLSFFLSSR
jgi:hypothetical protein